jgi:hypothetical protein
MTVQEEIVQIESQLRLLEIPLPCNCSGCQEAYELHVGAGEVGYLTRLRLRLTERLVQ